MERILESLIFYLMQHSPVTLGFTPSIGGVSFFLRNFHWSTMKENRCWPGNSKGKDSPPLIERRQKFLGFNLLSSSSSSSPKPFLGERRRNRLGDEERRLMQDLELFFINKKWIQLWIIKDSCWRRIQSCFHFICFHTNSCLLVAERKDDET